MRKFITLFAIIMGCILQTVHADTNVSGVISSNTTWTAAASPYIVTSYITVNHGVTLTIQSGVTVKFNDSQYMLAYGKLDANTVIFTTSNPSPAPGRWQFIQCGGTAPSDSGWVILNNCQVLYADKFLVYNGKATLTGTVLQNFNYYGAQVEAAGTFNMTGGLINTNSTWAANYGCNIWAKDNSHSAVSGVNMQHAHDGIYLQSNAKVDIIDATISNCTWPVTYVASAHLTASGTNTFTGNVNTAVYMNFSNFSDTLTLPTLNIPYYFISGMTVNASGRMVIGSNNVLKFPLYYSLTVNGALVAEANVGEFIYFTSIRDDNWGGDTNNDGSTTAPASSNWYGIRFEDPSNDATCLMRRCKVRYAGCNNTGGISMFNSSPTIDLCDLSNNYFGVYMQYASNPVFSNNTIGSSQWTPIAMSFEANPTMPNNVLSFSDNAYDCIGLLGGTLTANAVIRKRSVTTVQNITYLMLDQIVVPAGKSLTINKGVVIKSYSIGHRIIVDGALNASATADSLITFTSAKDDNYGNPGDSNKDGTITSPSIGDWGGIIFDPGSTGTLNYCRIKYASNWNYGFSTCSTTEYLNEAGVGMVDASPVISNCEFKDLKYGISCYRASNPTISNNSMINITYTPFCISGASDPAFTGNTFTNVTWRAIGLLGGYVCQNGTIKKRNVAGYTNITYILLADMYINSGTSINTESGIVIKMNNYTSIYIDGGFKTDGSTDQNVVFTSVKDDNVGNPFDSNGDGNATAPAKNDWGTIKYRATSDDAYSKINYSQIKYGGYTQEGGITFENAGGQINNSVISDCYYYGVYSNGNSTPQVNTLTIQNCRLDPVAMSLLSNPSLANVTFSANGSKAIKIIEGTLSSDATLATRNVAGITNIAYIIDNLTISSNARFLIQPGVVIKFRDDNYYNGTGIEVLGKLIAKGLPGNKIYLTSYADDSKGGDSNNNGNTTEPSKGDWGWSYYYYNYNAGINFNNTVSDTVSYCEISYPSNGIYFGNAHSIIDNCLIQQVYNFGLDIFGSANPSISNCQFNNITYSPVRLSMFSNPTFTNCTSLNVGRMALTVRAETYSQSAVVPKRNFGGYDNITYFMEGICTINSGTTITIPAGIVFKSGPQSSPGYPASISGFTVNGRLNILGADTSKVVFTEYRDDAVGNPPDMNQDGTATQPADNPYYGWYGTWLTFNDVSNDSSTIQYASFKYSNTAIALTSASPNINSVRFERDQYGVDLNGVSTPKIDSCTFSNLMYYPMQISLVSYPSSSANNLISGKTYKVIKVRDETLTQDVTLPKRNFGGISNICYLFDNYTIGTGATLTLSPGVVCKFLNDSYGGITVNKGLIAEGGFDAPSNIVFTDIRDDFYGGDSNSDTARTVPAKGSWKGITFNDQSLDPLCRIVHGIISYSNYGINTISASPLVTYSSITKNYYGVYATAASNPVFHYCDFDDNYYWSIDNVDKSFTIDATNCWWGSNLGPIQTNTQGNGTSSQELITTAVNYMPFKTTGAKNPAMGDVSLNGIIQAYDASLVLQYAVGSITLDATQQVVADVSAAAGITAYDASLILQYVVGIIQYFPAELLKSEALALTGPVLSVGTGSALNGQDVIIPIRVISGSGMTSADIKLQYDPTYLQVNQVTNLMTNMGISTNIENRNGVLSIGMAGTDPLSLDTTIILVSFHANLPQGGSVTTPVLVSKFLANESDLTATAIPGSITITDYATGISGLKDHPGRMSSVYPNPSSGNSTLKYEINGNNLLVNIEVFNLMGQKVATLVNKTMSSGTYFVSVSGSDSPLQSGTYTIRMSVDGFSQTQMFQIVR